MYVLIMYVCIYIYIYIIMYDVQNDVQHDVQNYIVCCKNVVLYKQMTFVLHCMMLEMMFKMMLV